MTIETGTVIAGRYEVLEPLGHGGMATVFRARRRPGGRLVALKVLYDQYAHAPEFVTRFQREARAAASLAHPHIVRVLDSGHDRGVWYMAMEHVEGETLKQRLSREGPLPVDAACAIAAQVCDALAYAHSRGLVHRDIKPQNILLTPDGGVKVTDFGIARAHAASTITQPGSVLGTAQYLSPEQARGEAAGERSDLYAVGVVLYEMVTGRLPFAGESAVALALKHIQDVPPSPRTLDPRIPERVEQIILRAMAKRPALRYASAADLRDDLTGDSHHWEDALTVVLPPEEETAILPPPAPAVPSARPIRHHAGALVPAGQPGRPRRGASVPAIGLVAVFAVLFAAWLALGASGLGGMRFPAIPGLSALSRLGSVAVPNLRGLPLAAAEAVAAARSLQVTVKRSAFDATQPKDAVISQDPAPGALVRRRSIISLAVSRGAPPVQQLKDQDENDGGKERNGDAKKDGKAGGDSPEAVQAPEGPAQAPDSPQAEGMVQVPDLRGQSLEEAIALLQSAGLQVGAVEQTTMVEGPARRVISQFPAAQARVRRGTAINLLVIAR